MTHITRRKFLTLAGGTLAMGSLGFPYLSLAGSRHVVVVGGGIGGATAAKYIRMADDSIDVTIVEPNKHYYTCFMSNEVLGGHRDINSLKFGYDGLKDRGIKVIHELATGIDPVARKVTTSGGKTLSYDRCIVSPGVDFKWGVIEGYTPEVSEKMPHAWKAGPQTLLLRKQLQAMKDGGTLIIVPPKKPFRCPPGPYERASLMAHYLKTNKPKSKILILDSNPSHSKQAAFHEGWASEYGNMIEWVKDTDGGAISSADAGTMTLRNDFGDEYKGDVINLIPYQKAGALVEDNGLTNKDGWCNVDMGTFESKVAKDVHIIGDACVAGAMPKSGHSAASQAKNCAAAIVSGLAGNAPPEPTYANTCYSLIAPTYGISVAAVYRLKEGVIVKVSGGVSKVGNKDRVHKDEAKYARGWYKSITMDMFG